MLPEVDHLEVLLLRELTGGRGHDDLATVCARHQARGAVDRTAVVVTVAQLDLARVQAHAHPQGPGDAPILPAQVLLGGSRGGKAVTEDPSLLAQFGSAAEAIAGSCRYGQALGEAQDHYEETNSLGWDLETDILAAVGRLTGNDDPSTVNPAFDGFWMGYTPS